MAEGGKDLEILLNGSKQQPDERCRYSSLDITRECEAKVAVCVVDAQWDLKLYYKVGDYDDRSNRINWGRLVTYDSGRFPSVALVHKDSRLYAVEIHCSDLRSRLFYRVGRVNREQKSISWSTQYGTRFDGGKKPKICAARDCVVIVFEDSINSISYCVGNLSTHDNEVGVNWSEVKPIEGVSGVEPDISVHSNRVVVAFRSGLFNYKIDTVVGTLNGDEIDWNVKEIETIDGGFSPSISVNSHDSIVLFYQGRMSTIWHVGGKVEDGRVTWETKSTGKSAAGEAPTVLLTDGNAIILIHNSDPLTLRSMFQCEGRLENV